MKLFIFTFITGILLLSCSVQGSVSDLSSKDASSIVIEDNSNYCMVQDASIDALSVVQKAYGYLFSGNIQSFADCMADDVEWIHYGPSGTIPVYGTYYGKSGVLQWANNLFTSVQMNYFDIHYFVVQGNHVHAQVREGCYSYGAMNQMYIENFHSFEVNNQGKISKMIVISESYTGVTAYFGENGKIYETQYPNLNYFSNYKVNRKDIINTALSFFRSCSSGKLINLKHILSDNAEFVFTGPENIVPFMGKFSGDKKIKKFIDYLSDDINLIKIKYIIYQNNKINVYAHLYGRSSIHKRFDSEACFTFQLNDIGKIEKLYIYSDNYSISRAYIK